MKFLGIFILVQQQLVRFRISVIPFSPLFFKAQNQFTVYLLVLDNQQFTCAYIFNFLRVWYNNLHSFRFTLF